MATYKIIGHDQKEYGPLAEDQLRRWLAEGRVNAATKVLAEGAAEWQALGDIPGFQPGTASPAGPAPLVATRTSALAIWSLVLGILGVLSCGLTAIAGLILGILAMTRIKDSRGTLSGHGLALAGTIISGIFILLIPLAILGGMLLPALARAKQKAEQIACVNNEKQLALALRIYLGDHGNHFPAATNWCDAIKPLVGAGKVYQCPAARSDSRCGYAFNAKLDGLDANQVSPRTVLLFESDAGWNASGGPELLPTPPHHRLLIVAFADGSVQQVSTNQFATLQWTP